MDTNELKFLLKLLGFPNYRAGLSASAFDVFRREKNKICLSLGDRDLVGYTREIATVKILPPGQALLKLDSSQLPIKVEELKVLEKVSKASGKIAPSTITSPKAAERDAILTTLSEKGLIQAEIKLKKTKAEVWLTERGIEFLRDDYHPNKGSNPVMSLELLGNYLGFLRKTLRVKPESVPTLPPTKVVSGSETIINISDEEVLQTITNLDKKLGTDNYLPIFHLREKLQPPLSRDELDQALYRLQKTDKIELSTVLDPTAYTQEQVDAGIQQNVGGSLFFISIN